MLEIMFLTAVMFQGFLGYFVRVLQNMRTCSSETFSFFFHLQRYRSSHWNDLLVLVCTLKSRTCIMVDLEEDQNPLRSHFVVSIVPSCDSRSLSVMLLLVAL